ncbi:hypothetical protein V6N12_009827 [Hibiscus sabdariffa]|uniref:Uncharacterized protein n=1 Tax=Hibiscus sabdariffa TaxID=183260 RepID=A0ABR2EBW1_9ROSI
MIMKMCNLKAIKPLKNEEMTTNKGPLSEVSIERMVRTIEVDKGNEKVDSFAKDVCMSNEVWMKVISIEDKIDAITRMLGKVAATVQMIDLAQNLFYAYVKTWHKYALVAMRRVVTVSLPEFLEFAPIICNYDFSSNAATKEVPVKSINHLRM